MTIQNHAFNGPVLIPIIEPDRLQIRRLRQQIEEELDRAGQMVDRLISILDAIDGDPDLEPSLGWSATGATSDNDRHVHLMDLEEGHDGREPDVDDEDGGDLEQDPAEAGICDPDAMDEYREQAFVKAAWKEAKKDKLYDTMPLEYWPPHRIDDWVAKGRLIITNPYEPAVRWLVQRV